MTIADTQFEIIQTLRKHRRSIAELLAPLGKIAALSPNLVAYHDAQFQISGETYELPCYLFVGPKGGDVPLRVGIFAAIHGDEPEGAHAVVQFIKPRKTGFKAIAVEPAKSPVISGGQPGPHKLQGIGAGFIPANLNTKIVDEVIKVNEEDSGPISKEVNRLDGIPVGISSGAAIWAALQVAKRPENKGKIIVAIVPSSAERYLSAWLFAEVDVNSDSVAEFTPAPA